MRPEAVLFDMDGTLCDVRSIRHLVTGPEKNFDAFHLRSGECPPHAHVVEAAHQARRDGLGVLIVTARQARYRNVTAMWLALHGVPSDALFMRANGDFRPDVQVKQDILARIRQRWVPVCAWDDNPAIVDLWASEGISCVVVSGWNDSEPSRSGDVPA
jgi:phosphoglycolate phosphatase-like HAD superfamily hydrolase